MAGLDPTLFLHHRQKKSWMPGSYPGMTLLSDLAAPLTHATEQAVERRVIDAEFVQMRNRVGEIGRVRATLAAAGGDHFRHLVFRQPPGILAMLRIGHEGEHVDALPAVALGVQAGAMEARPVHAGYHLAAIEIVDHRFLVALRHPEG